MSEIEILEVQIGDLKNAYNDLISALNNLADVDGLDEQYKELDRKTQEVDEQRIKLETELEELLEEAFYRENEEQWEKEQKEQEYAYWQSQF